MIDDKGTSLGQVNTDQALLLAFERGLDLVEIAPASVPPVAKITDYGKYLYEQQKKQRKAKSHQKESKVKEIQLSFKIEEHDFKTKANHAIVFMSQGHKVRLFMKLRGRERAFSADATAKLEQFVAQANAKFETHPKQLGGQISAIIIKQ